MLPGPLELQRVPLRAAKHMSVICHVRQTNTHMKTRATSSQTARPITTHLCRKTIADEHHFPGPVPVQVHAFMF